MPTLADTSNGQVRVTGNELMVDAKDADDSKVRVGSIYERGVHGGGGAYSFDALERVGDGERRVEAAVIVGANTGKGGEVGISIWNGRDFRDIQDADQIKVMELRHNEVEIKVPLRAPNLGGGGAVTRSQFYSANGRWLWNYQDDGHIVQYDTHHPAFNTSNPGPAAVWSNWFGLIKPLPW